jgi:uncharacterized damage-inducible protein DinB/Zn finger protein HypA/HybF involved in hydrogenase expression
MDQRLERIGRLAAVARGLEREGAYNGSKLVRLALERELVRYAEVEAGSGGEQVAAALEALVATDRDALPRALTDRLSGAAATVRAGGTILLAEAPRARLCRYCGETFLGEEVPLVCPTCEAPALSFHEELPVWFLEPAERGTLLAAMTASTRQLADALAPRSDEELGRAPAAGEWSARQTLEHLLYAEELFAERIERLLTEDGPDLAARAVWSETPASDEGTVETGQPASALAARWIELRTTAVERLATIPESGWARAGMHPEWGRVTVLSQAGYFTRHTTSHTAQLVAAAEGRLPGGR